MIRIQQIVQKVFVLLCCCCQTMWFQAMKCFYSKRLYRTSLASTLNCKCILFIFLCKLIFNNKIQNVDLWAFKTTDVKTIPTKVKKYIILNVHPSRIYFASFHNITCILVTFDWVLALCFLSFPSCMMYIRSSNHSKNQAKKNHKTHCDSRRSPTQNEFWTGFISSVRVYHSKINQHRKIKPIFGFINLWNQKIATVVSYCYCKCKWNLKVKLWCKVFGKSWSWFSFRSGTIAAFQYDFV